jgi:Protein of unknown function (DUF_B2219)
VGKYFPARASRHAFAVAGCLLLVLLTTRVGTSESVRLTDRPVTIQVDLPEQVVAKQKTTTDEVGALLRIEGVSTDPPQTATVRVFVDRPAANGETPVSDAQFVGYFTLVPRSSKSGGPKEGQSFLFELPRRLLTPALDRSSIQVTFVPIAAAPTPPTITVKRTSVDLPTAGS